MDYASSILDLVGDTPLVRISRLTRDLGPGRPPAAAAREARDAQPRRVGEGPDRAADDRGGGARRPAPAGRDDHRADVRQHRPRPRDRGRAQGLPLHLRHGRQAVRREAGAPARVRRRGRAVPDQRRAGRPEQLLLGRRPPRPRHPGRVQARPVLERREPVRARADDRPRDLGPDRGADHAPRGERRDRRHGERDRALPQGAERRDPGHRRRPGGLDPVGRRRAPVPHRGRGRGLPAGHVRRVGRGPLGPRLGPRRVRDGPPDHARGGDPRRRVVRDGDARRARRDGPAHARRARRRQRTPSSS